MGILIIRRASLKDYEELCSVFAECDALHSAHHPSRVHALADPQTARTREHISELIFDPNTALLVAEQEAHLVGAIVVIIRDAPPIPILTPRRFANVEIVAVRQGQHGRGIGRALMTRAEEWARSMGAQDIELSVYSFNQEAVRFYEGLEY